MLCRTCCLILIQTHVAYSPVAFGASGRPLFHIPVGCNIADHSLVAADAVMLKGRQVASSDTDRLPKILQCKGLGMVPTVIQLCHVFFRKGMRHMAIIAGRNSVVTRLDPGIVMFPHDV